LHLTVEPTEQVILFSSKGRLWKGAVGFIPEEATPQAMGLAQDETIVGAEILKPGTCLVMISRAGKIKRTKADDLSLMDRTWDVIMGLTEGEPDALLIGSLADDNAQVLFYTREAQALRVDANTVNPQQTGSASGVVGIKVREEDRLLGAVVIPNGAKEEAQLQVVVASEAGYVHRFPLTEIGAKGRGSMGMRCLRTSKAAGMLGGLAVGREDDGVDFYLDDGRRFHSTIKALPLTARDVQGNRVIKDPKKQPVVQAVVLR
jgi:DNA gyrase subunit A